MTDIFPYRLLRERGGNKKTNVITLNYDWFEDMNIKLSIPHELIKYTGTGLARIL
jgi:hypothetical protein